MAWGGVEWGLKAGGASPLSPFFFVVQSFVCFGRFVWSGMRPQINAGICDSTLVLLPKVAGGEIFIDQAVTAD